MLPLPELQFRLVAALFGGSGDSIAPWILDDGIDGEARIGIYRSNLREGFAKTLALEFPVIERLVGCDYWRQLAREFQADHPSRSGNLHHIGAPFAAFLRQRFGATQYAYLADVAELEWAYQEAMVAADAPPLDVSALQSIAPEHYPQLGTGPVSYEDSISPEHYELERRAIFERDCLVGASTRRSRG